MLYNFAPSHILVALLPDGLDPKEWFYHPFLTVKKVGYSDLTLWKNEFFHFCKMQTSSKHQMEQLCLTHFVLNITSAHFAWIFNFFDLLGCRVVPVKNFCRKTCNSNANFCDNHLWYGPETPIKMGIRVARFPRDLEGQTFRLNVITQGKIYVFWM